MLEEHFQAIGQGVLRDDSEIGRQGAPQSEGAAVIEPAQEGPDEPGRAQAAAEILRHRDAGPADHPEGGENGLLDFGDSEGRPEAALFPVDRAGDRRFGGAGHIGVGIPVLEAVQSDSGGKPGDRFAEPREIETSKFADSADDNSLFKCL